MKTCLTFPTILILACGIAGCCGSEEHVADDTTHPAATYKAGHGLQFSEAARALTGLAVAEVATHAFAGRPEATAIPATALLRSVKGDFVFVVNGDWFLKTPVKIGAVDATHVEIVDGLYEGDAVAVAGVRALALAEIQALNGGVGCADGH